MFNISKQRVIVITLYHSHRQQKEQEEAAKIQEISQELLAKAAVTFKLNKAEEQLMNGDYDAALPVIRKMAADGNVDAQHDLGWAYREGLGVDQDYAQALNWFTKAAEAGEASASYYVGEIYYKGLGTVKADKDKAIKWLTQAKAHGIKEAAQTVKEIEY